MTYPYISGINYESIADGPGVRAAIFLSGCNHSCPGCHNPQAQDPQFGQPITDELIEGIANNIASRDYLSGITLTGGDPLFDVEKTCNFLLSLRKSLGCLWGDYSVWLYTGYTWGQLMKLRAADEYFRTLLSMVDVVVDGPFVQSLADKRLAFCGSSNQRVIDVRGSLKLGLPLLFNPVH